MNCFSASDFNFSLNSVVVLTTSLPNNLSNNSWSKSASPLELISLTVKITSIFKPLAISTSSCKYLAKSLVSLKRSFVFKLIISPTFAPINFFKLDLPLILSTAIVEVKSISSLSLKNCPVTSSPSLTWSLEIKLPYCF